MSLVDQTNFEIPLLLELAIHGVPSETLQIDTDQDSSFYPEPWVYFSLGVQEDVRFLATLEEAGRIHDRLGLILGRGSRVTVDSYPFAVIPAQPGESDDDHVVYQHSSGIRWQVKPPTRANADKERNLLILEHGARPGEYTVMTKSHAQELGNAFAHGRMSDHEVLA